MLLFDFCLKAHHACGVIFSGHQQMNEGQESMWFIFVLAWVSRKQQHVLILIKSGDPKAPAQSVCSLDC